MAAICSDEASRSINSILSCHTVEARYLMGITRAAGAAVSKEKIRQYWYLENRPTNRTECTRSSLSSRSKADTILN